MTNAGTWSSAELPLSLRAQAARAVLSGVHLPWSLDLPDRAPHDMRLNWHDLAGCALVECRSAPLSGRRDHGEIRRTDGDHVGLLLVMAGEERVRQGDLAVRLGAGDMLLWDSGQPIRFEVASPLHKVTLLVPRERLKRALPDFDPRGAARLESQHGLGALAAAHLASLARIAPQMPAGHAPLAADILIDLVARMLAPPASATTRSDLIARVVAHVEDHLDDPALTPSRIAARLEISARYLHMQFSATGETLSTHIRTRRLAAMRRDLADPRLAGRTITEIALRWGFADAAHASRAFSAAFGVSPSRYRAGRK